MRRAALAAVLLLSLAGCRGDFFDPTPGATAGTEQPRVELIVQNVRILPGGEGAVRIGFRPKDVSAHLRVERSESSGRVIACPLRSVDDAIPAETECLPDLPHGVREGLTLQGLGAIALIREGAPLTVNIRLEYEEAGREIMVRTPIIERPPGASVCKDNACNPFVEIRPVRSGGLTATAHWSGGTARLELLEGRVIARSFSSTGIPYRTAARREGSSPLSIAAQIQAPSEFALAFLNASTGDLTDIEIVASWP